MWSEESLSLFKAVTQTDIVERAMPFYFLKII